jgi:hypothetical protein
MKKPTKKWRYEKAREIIDRNRLNHPFNNQDLIDFSTICEKTITGAVRKINPQFPSDPRHLHTEVDGKWAARSWKKWIYPESPEATAKKAMRDCVREDLRDFLSCVDPQECVTCGSTNDLTVDHVFPPFDDIANKFINDFGLPKIIESTNHDIVFHEFESIDLEASWIAFHASMSCYQVLCRSCNSRKGKK